MMLAARAPEVLVLDLNLRGGDSLHAIPEFRGAYPRLGILVLAAQEEQYAGVKVILLGANGYLNKTTPPEQLVEAVRLVANGRPYVSPALGVAMAEYLAHGRNGKQPHETLSAREHSVLLKIAEGFTTAEIAEQLNLSSKTVGTYRARVLEKLGISTTAELTRYVIEHRLAV
jgi:DNA-binding NarL/FixJ family response regulator